MNAITRKEAAALDAPAVTFQLNGREVTGRANQTIIEIAKLNEVDAIHPGYGFLSENVEFATRCREEGIVFVGPTPEAMAQLGDKVQAKANAIAAGLPVIEDSKQPLKTLEIAQEEARRIGFPLMLKAAAGGGGRKGRGR